MEEETATATADNTPGPNLSPPASFATALKHFQEIVSARGPQTTNVELERLFSATLSGILDACAEGAMQLADIRRSNIYKLNYLTALRATLRSVVAAAPPVGVPLEKANKEIQSLRDQSVEMVITTLLENSGVGMVLQEMDTRREPEQRRQWLVANLDGAAQNLDDFLASALMDVQDNYKSLIDRSLAKDIVVEAVDKFCAEFDELEAMLDIAQGPTTPDDGEDAEAHAALLRELYPRTGQEVRALLS